MLPPSKPNFTAYGTLQLERRVLKMRQTLYLLSHSRNYLLPAIFLNPAVVLHVINTAISHLQGASYVRSLSPNPFIESLGPVPESELYFDMHANDRLCWNYTALMVLVQLLVMWKLHANIENEREDEMLLPTQRNKEEGRIGKSEVEVDVDAPAEFYVDYMVDGQTNRKETFVK